MREDFPRISVTNPKRYKALWRDENREHLREYDKLYGRKRRAKLKRKRNGK